MNTFSKACATIALTGLLGCTARPTLPTAGAERPGFLRQQAVPTVLAPPATSRVILDPGQGITLTYLEAKRSEYLCSNGRQLRYDRFGLKLYCSCPGL